MATAYQNTPFAGAPMPTQVGQNEAYFQFNIATQTGSPLGTSPGFVINDTVNLVQIPNFVQLNSLYLDYCSLDSSTGVVTSIGDNVSASHGGAGAGGFFTGITLGRSSAGGSVGRGGTGYVHGTLPWLYAVPWANVPTVGIWLMFKVTTAATGTAATSGIIYGTINYTLLSQSTNASGTAPLSGAL